MNAARVLAAKLSGLPPASPAVLIGLDGFVDRILHVVDKRYDAENCSYVRTLADYGRKVGEAAGLSLNVEVICDKSQLGGNGPIMAKACAALGAEVACVGALGLPEIAPEFSQLAKSAALYPISEPARTDAWEFEDGKIIVSQLQPLNRLSWASLHELFCSGELRALLDKADLIALNNWTMIPAMSDIWRELQLRVLPELAPKDRLFFFDLADPSKRTEEDLLRALELLSGFVPYGRVLLSCNKRELLQIAAALGLGAPAEAELCRAAEEIRGRTGVWAVSVHTLEGAFAASEEGQSKAEGFYTPRPLISVGGGDHFNAGLAWALLRGLSWQDALLTGSAVSGCFVRTGASPTLDMVIRFLTTGGQRSEYDA